jgi:alpha-L-fucosidase
MLNIKKFILFLFVLVIIFFAKAQKINPVPTKAQLAWHEMEFYLFVHFGPNTFSDKEWGEGTEPEDIFNPAHLDCRQWCRIAKASGAKGIIVTAKHHDGFCLWPSKYSKHTVRESKWKKGKGDVLKELSQACKEYGLKFGVYISPWDRNHPKYGTDGYNDVFVNMMKEIFHNYGPIWELWWDGANGEGPNGKKQVYDWKRFEKTVREMSPQTIIFSDIGPDIRWCGNENGIAGETNWNYLDTEGFIRGVGAPPVDTLNQGNINGKNWIPAEGDVSIRPGWFYHKEEDEKVKTPEQLFQLYLKSVGRGANLLLNVPPDRNGMINGKDWAVLVGFKKLRDESFGLSLVSKKPDLFAHGQKRIHIDFKKESSTNCIILCEELEKGQSVKRFRISLYDKNVLIKTIEGTTIGRKRIVSFPAEKITRFILEIVEAKRQAIITNIGAYLIDETLIEK